MEYPIIYGAVLGTTVGVALGRTFQLVLQTGLLILLVGVGAYYTGSDIPPKYVEAATSAVAWAKGNPFFCLAVLVGTLFGAKLRVDLA